jgi:toxin ParE1/3/4
MNVRFSRQARADLANIAGFVAKDNPARADSFTDELEASSLALSQMPNAFQVFGSRNGQEVRQKPHGSHVILYRVTAHHVDILRIVHGARDYRKTFLSKK